jgi:hypothetical protein
MRKRARTPIVEYDDLFSIELPGDGPPQERDRLTDQFLVVAYDRLSRKPARWRLRALHFDRDEWTRSGIRRWWAAHEVHFLAADGLDTPIPEICRAYDSAEPSVPTIVLCHRNTPMIPADQQMMALRRAGRRRGPHRG